MKTDRDLPFWYNRRVKKIQPLTKLYRKGATQDNELTPVLKNLSGGIKRDLHYIQT